MKTNWLLMASLLCAVSTAVQAGKVELDFYKEQVEPALITAATTLKQSCGCSINMNVRKESFESVPQLRQIRHSAGMIIDNAPRYCNDAPSKAAVCKLKTLEYARTGTTAFKFAAGKGVITLDESSYPSWDMLAAELDK